MTEQSDINTSVVFEEPTIIIINPPSGISPAVKSSASPSPVISKPTSPSAPSSTSTPTLVASVLDSIPDKGGLDIVSLAQKHYGSLGLLDKATQWRLSLSGAPVDNAYRDGFVKSLTSLGVNGNAAHGFTYDDSHLSDHEGVEVMARIGNATFANIKPDKATIAALGPVFSAIEKKEGIKLTDDTKNGLARFESGMLGVLTERMRHPESSLGSQFHGALSDPGTGVKGVIDFIAESAKAVPKGP